MKNIFFALIAILLFAGCATTAGIESLETRVGALESQISAANDAARAATAAAERASREAGAAQSAAERALDTANEANERVRRLAEADCCAAK